MADTQPLLRDPSTSGYGGTAGAPTSTQPYPPQGGPPPPSGGPEQQSTVPPANVVDAVSGYEGVTFQGGDFIAPPSYDEATTAPSQPSAPPPPPPTHVTEDQARHSLLDLTGQNFCWGKKAAEEMTISSITSSSAFHYKLDTFTESRKTTWTHSPYYGDAIDGPFNGPAPPPWSIPIQPDGMFRQHEKRCEVPHTACVKPCHDCAGTGSRTCHQCRGAGRACCTWCNGSGYQAQLHVEGHHGHGHHGHGHGHHGHGHGHHDHHHHVHTDMTLCRHCAGTGNKVCGDCNGCGRVNCRTCKTKGQLKYYIELTISWKIHSNDHIVESTALPDHLIRGAGGQVAFEESGARVAPVGHFPNVQINSASQRLVGQHASAFPTERILMQRHNVRIVPVSEVNSDYKGALFTYWVYGTQNLAFAPDYPQQCCCGCSII